MRKVLLSVLFVFLLVFPLGAVAHEPRQTWPAPLPQVKDSECCEGKVLFKGRIEDLTTAPLKGSVVRLYAGDGTTVLDEETVGHNGTFTLGFDEVCEGDVYIVREVDPPGYGSVSASGPGATVVGPNELRFQTEGCRNIAGILFVDDHEDPSAPYATGGTTKVCVTAVGADGTPAKHARVWIYTMSPGFLIVAGYGVTDSNGKVEITTTYATYAGGNRQMGFSARQPYEFGDPPLPTERSVSYTVYVGTRCIRRLCPTQARRADLRDRPAAAFFHPDPRIFHHFSAQFSSPEY